MGDDAEFAQCDAEFRLRDRANLQIPTAIRHLDYNVHTVRTGIEVVADAGLTLDEVVADPFRLLTGSAYQDGNVMRCDPFHPATRALIALRLAAATSDADVLGEAVTEAHTAIAQHGVPPEIDCAYAVGTRGEDFCAVEVIAAMWTGESLPVPRRNLLRRLWSRLWRRLRWRLPPPTLSPEQWRERADAAYTMAGALVAMPADHPARPAVCEYTRAVMNPGVPGGLMEPYERKVYDALMKWAKTHKGSGWGPHEQSGRNGNQ